MKLEKGKINLVIDGQFGSTGKGLLSHYIASLNSIDISISNASANAGHTFYHNGIKHVSKYIPVSSVINDKNLIYLSGAIINTRLLFEEIDKFSIDPNRLSINPSCPIITEDDILSEGDNSSAEKIASTQSGVGAALANKVNRCGMIARDCKELKSFVNRLALHKHLDEGFTLLMEVPQGLDLSLSSNFYPYCTSREINISHALSDANAHPYYLGKVAVAIRCHPIRVGNIYRDGKEVGYSGKFYEDSIETSWEEIGVKEERTTVTNRVRRVATFSMKQYDNMLNILRPDYILLNFANYLSKEELNELIKKLPEVTHLGFSPYIEDIIKL